MNKKIFIIMSIIITTLLLFSCKNNNNIQNNIQSTNDTMHYALLEDMTTMDMSQTTYDYFVPMNIFDTLFIIEKENNSSIIKPSLCENYNISEDGLTYNFTIKQNILFSNGSKLTSEDVKYTFERLLFMQCFNMDIPLEVKGAQDFIDKKDDNLSGFKIIDDYNFNITLQNNNASFIAELASPVMSIIDKETTEKATNFGMDCDETVGTGPYKITEWVKNDHFTFEYNNKYWGNEPDIKKMVIHIIPDPSTMDLMFQNKELDAISLYFLNTDITNKIYKTKYKNNLIYNTILGLSFLALNENNKYLQDVNVRKAIQKAINVDAIVNSVCNEGAIAQHGIIPSGIIGHNDKLKTMIYNPDEAKLILKNAGYKDGDITLELAESSDAQPIDLMVDQIIQQDLKKIDINVEFTTYEVSTWTEKRSKGELDSYVGNWYMDYNDPSNIMDTFFASQKNTSMRSLNYKDIDTINKVSNAKSIIDENERIKEYQKLEEKIIKEDAAIAPLFENTEIYCLGDKILSLTPHWAGYAGVFNIKDIKLK